ncbi:DoxX family membrane protein [Candidatus Halobonum tyrrellensis]|uniref:DoxX family protein n=1 Tax=Candidatus Halobonum tyrrellensis G22 TaxID=1324957 RepID=V4J3I3_9EURY|nr:DoxX family membrane protein [Candidatus Halobonum tyrrellensis]ESP89947.1 DoxX family protein [Candidatus Halobonum tyrrellensis G22]
MATNELDTTVLNDDVTLSLSGPWVAYWALFLRVLVGYWFLHAGLTKVLFGFSAAGYLGGASRGAITEPIMQVFANGALLTFTNYAVGWGELLIGLGLLVGAFVRLASFFGGVLMFFFYFTNHGWANGMTNGDLWGLLLFVTLAILGAGRVWGVDGYLEDTEFVREHRWARYLLG